MEHMGGHNKSLGLGKQLCPGRAETYPSHSLDIPCLVSFLTSTIPNIPKVI